MGIVTWIVLGLVAGILTHLLMPGKGPGGIVWTILLGIAGALVGGYIGSHLFGEDITGFNIRSVLLAVGGAVLLLVVYGFLKKSKIIS
jgi:uncharacterized membrane protein YeaQ/YmgE (transglycosylase-associated protein family)